MRPASFLYQLWQSSAHTVWAVAERLGLRPLGLISVDDMWSAFRLKRGDRTTAGA